MIRLEHILPRAYHHRSRSDHPLRQRGTAAGCKALCKCPRKKLHVGEVGETREAYVRPGRVLLTLQCRCAGDGVLCQWLEHWIRLNMLALFLLTVALLPKLNS
ncbi:hypothetical protein PC123_g9110 [Phytophthora cactorum]|nr:hypothetical protein PC123_g9110 [Phytophthora cactorum]